MHFARFGELYPCSFSSVYHNWNLYGQSAFRKVLILQNLLPNSNGYHLPDPFVHSRRIHPVLDYRFILLSFFVR